MTKKLLIAVVCVLALPLLGPSTLTQADIPTLASVAIAGETAGTPRGYSLPSPRGETVPTPRGVTVPTPKSDQSAATADPVTMLMTFAALLLRGVIFDQ